MKIEVKTKTIVVWKFQEGDTDSIRYSEDEVKNREIFSLEIPDHAVSFWFYDIPYVDIGGKRFTAPNENESQVIDAEKVREMQRGGIPL